MSDKLFIIREMLVVVAELVMGGFAIVGLVWVMFWMTGVFKPPWSDE